MSRNAIRNGLVIALLVSAGLTVMMAILIYGRPRNAAPAGELDPTVHRGNEPLPVLYSIGEFSFPDQDGRSVSPEDLRGQVWVASIFFGHCKAICPGVVKQLKKLHDAVTDPRVRIVTFTLDPERDTPERLAAYVGAFNPAFYGVHIPEDELTRVKKEYGVYAEKNTQVASQSAADYLVDHTAFVYIIDKQNNLREIFAHDAPKADIAADISYLARE